MAQQISTNTFGCAKWIVSADATQGTHTTISAALTSASSGDTIFIRPGTYVENITFKAGVNLSAYVCDGLNLGHVVIQGKSTFSTAGTVVCSGITFETNSDYCLNISGTVASLIYFTNCSIVANDHNPISFTSTSASAFVFFQFCNTNITNALYNLYDMTSPGSLSFYYTSVGAAGNVASNNSAGIVSHEFVSGNCAMSTSSTGILSLIHCDFDSVNTTCITLAGTGTSTARYCTFISGTSSAISIGTGTTFNLNKCTIGSTNTNAITGAGTLNYANIDFNLSSSTINVTTQTGGTLQGGKFQAPSAGFIGEQIRSAVASGSAINTPNNTATNITSISLTAGIWDVSAVAAIQSVTTGTYFNGSINTTSATQGTAGDNMVQITNLSNTNNHQSLSIPSYRLTLTTTTTVYLVGFAIYSVGTATTFGRISATRVG